MKATLQFKAQITTERTYPYSLEIVFTFEQTNAEDVYSGVYDYIESMINDKVVSATIECVGYRTISDARFWELNELAKQHVERVQD